MSVPTLNEPQAIIGRDATLLTVESVNASTGAVASISGGNVLAIWQEASIMLKRDYTPTKAANDPFQSKRAMAWGEGSVELKGLQKGASGMAAIMNSGSHGLLMVNDGADTYGLLVLLETLKKSLSEKANEDSLTLPIVSVPYLNGAAMVLES